MDHLLQTIIVLSLLLLLEFLISKPKYLRFVVNYKPLSNYRLVKP